MFKTQYETHGIPLQVEEAACLLKGSHSRSCAELVAARADMRMSRAFSGLMLARPDIRPDRVDESKD